SNWLLPSRTAGLSWPGAAFGISVRYIGLTTCSVSNSPTSTTQTSTTCAPTSTNTTSLIKKSFNRGQQPARGTSRITNKVQKTNGAVFYGHEEKYEKFESRIILLNFLLSVFSVRSVVKFFIKSLHLGFQSPKKFLDSPGVE